MFNRKSPKTKSRGHSKSFILEPILTPSSIVDTGFDDGLDVPDEGFSLPAEPLMNEGEGMTEGETGFPDDPGLPDGEVEILGAESSDVSAGDPGSEFEEIPYFPDDALIPQASNIEFTSGVFTVGESGEVSIDYLFDGGKYDRGELAIFSLDGMDSEPGTRAFIQEAAIRALSNSERGYVVISDAADAARFSNTAGTDFNTGEYRGVQTFQMRAGDRFGFMLVPNQSIQTAAEGRAWGTVFSMATDNPDDYFQFGQIADVTGDGNTFTLEDISLAGGRSDRDYNDIIFQVRGATADVPLMDEVLGVDQDWRTSSMGRALLNYAQAYTDNVDYSVAAFDAAREFQPLVGIIDTGFAANNPDIDYSNIITGSDFIDGDDNPFLEAGEGDNHGTQVVNVIESMNDDAPLWLGRAVGSGRWADSLVEFVDAAVDSGQPNAVVNLSLDLTQIDADGNVTTRYEFTPMEMAALEYARQNNVLVAVASGNQAGLMSALGQASMQFDNIITVGAAEQFDPAASNWQGYDRADYSSYGPGLDIMANGGTRENPIGGSYGSSMATAQVTGAISQIWAANPKLSYQQVIQILKQTATDLGVANPDLETGAGLLNVAAAVHLAKATKAEDYEKGLKSVPLTWSGEGEFTPMERAANPDDSSVSSTGFPQSVQTLSSFLSIFGSTTSSRFTNFLTTVFQKFHNSANLTNQQPVNYPYPSSWQMSSSAKGAGQVAAAQNQDGRLEAFVIGPNNKVYQAWQTEPNGGWSNWKELSGGTAKSLTVSRNKDGRLEVFSIGLNNKVYQAWQTEPNGGWSNWKQLSGGTTVQDLTVGQSADGRLEVFAVGTDSKVYQVWQTETNGSAGWSNWKQLSGGTAKSITVGRNKDGRLEVFTIGTNNKVYQAWQTEPNGGWSNWKQLSGGMAKSIEVGQSLDGRLEVFTVGTDNKVYQAWQTQPNGDWSGWKQLSGGTAKSVTVGRNKDGRLEVFAIGMDDKVYQAWQTQPNGGWSAWKQLSSDTVKHLTVSQNQDGRLEAFAVRMDNKLYHAWQNEPNGGWVNWKNFNISVSGISPIESSGSYYPKLASLSDSDWDKQSGDDNQFRSDSPYGGDNQMSKTSDEVRGVYSDLSKKIFKEDRVMNTGYAYDTSYYYANPSRGAHSGIDISNSSKRVHSPINGVVAIAPYKEIHKGKYNGWVMAIDETDSSGQKTGRRWWFVHLKPPGSYSLSKGSSVSAGSTILSPGNELNHLHLAVQNVSGSVSNGYGSYNQAVNSVLSRTMSPIQAFWKAQNGIKESVIWNK